LATNIGRYQLGDAMSKKNKFTGEWLTPTIKCHHVDVYAPNRPERIKRGWELRSHLAYVDDHNRMWVCCPGYVWDGPSYPSAKTLLGKFLRWSIGNRTKEGLLAASAIHDVANLHSRVYIVTESMIRNIKSFNDDTILKAYIHSLEEQYIAISIKDAAELYVNMLANWPVIEETIGSIRRWKQYIGLRIFQPIYNALKLGPGEVGWHKVKDNPNDK